MNETLGVTSMNDTLQILEKLNSLYSNLMIYLGILVTLLVVFVGVLIPFLTNWYQNRKLNIEKENLKTILFKELSSEYDSYIKSQEEKLEERIKKIEKNFEIKSSAIDGGTFHIQANNYLTQGLYGLALESYIIAATRYLLGEDETNLQRINKSLIDRCLPYINKSHLEENTAIVKKMNRLVDLLSENNQRGRYTDTINDMSREFEKAKKRPLKKNNSVQ